MQRKQMQMVAAGVALALLVSCLLRHSILVYQHYFGMYHDDGLYLVAAKSLAENLGYRILSLPTEPFQTKYPIGYPFLLSLIWRCCPNFPDSLQVFESFQVLCAVLAPVVMVAYLVSTRKLTTNLALVLASATLLNVRFIDFAPMIMSDMASALAISMCMWCAETESRGRDGFRFMTGAVLSLSVLMRGQSFVLIPAVWIYLALMRRYRMLVSTAVLSTLVVGAMWLWQAQHIVAVPPILYYYTSYFKHAVYTAPVWTFNMIAANAELSVVRAINTFIPGLEQIRYQQLSPLQFVFLYNVTYPIILAVVMLGICRGALKRSLPALFTLCYILSLLLWPCRLEWRYVLPIMVLGYFYFFVGMRIICRLAKPFGRRILRGKVDFAAVCRGAAVCASVSLIIGSAYFSCAKAGWLHCLETPSTPKSKSEIVEAFEWIKANTPVNATFVCNNDPSLYLYTNRKGIMPSSLELWRFVQDRYVDADSLLAAIKFTHAKYVMNEPAFRMMGFAYPQLADSILELNRRQHGMLMPVYSSRKGLITIYEVHL